MILTNKYITISISRRLYSGQQNICFRWTSLGCCSVKQSQEYLFWHKLKFSFDVNRVVTSTSNWIKCSESDKVGMEVRAKSPVCNISKIQYSLFFNRGIVFFYLAIIFGSALKLLQISKSRFCHFFVLLTCLLEFLVCLYVVVMIRQFL